MLTERIPLAQLPTPLHRLDVLSRAVGADIWVKRDDLTGFAMGGNKVRKAEYFMGDAIDRCVEVIVTMGAAQSNHARVIAAAARRHNLECHLVLSGAPDQSESGNLFLDRLAGARVHMIATAAERRISQPRWKGKTLSGREFLIQQVIPNFYFHVTTAYAILRHNGVGIGKKNYLGDMPFRDPA